MSANDEKVRALTPEEIEVSKQTAEALHEKKNHPRMLISRIVRHMGIEKTKEYLDRTKRIKHNGGLYMEDIGRYRTSGGIFFKIIKDEVDETLNTQLFFYQKQTARQKQLESSRNRGAPVFVWENRKQQLQAALEKREELEEVRVQIMGVPKTIETFHQNVVLVMEHEEDLSKLTMPNGIPNLPEEPTVYTIYVGSLQWSKVKKKMENPRTMLVIEGIGAYDPEIPGIAVYATSITTQARKMKHIEETEKQKGEKNKDKEQKKDTKEDTAKKNKKAQAKAQPAPKKKPAKEKAAAAPPPPEIKVEQLEVIIPDNAPDDVKQKLNELYKAAAQFQQKIKSIQSKPADEQFGLSMTDKLLKNVQNQIKKLVDQYS